MSDFTLTVVTNPAKETRGQSTGKTDEKQSVMDRTLRANRKGILHGGLLG